MPGAGRSTQVDTSLNRPQNYEETTCKFSLEKQKIQIPEIRIYSPDNEVKGQGQGYTDIACPLVYETHENNSYDKSYTTLKASSLEDTLELQGHKHVGQGHETMTQGHDTVGQCQGHETMTQGHDTVGQCQGHETMTQGHDTVGQCQGHETMSQGHDTVSQGHETRSQGHERMGQGHQKSSTSLLLLQHQCNSTLGVKESSSTHLLNSNGNRIEPSGIECQDQGYHSNQSSSTDHTQSDTEIIFPFSNDFEFDSEDTNLPEERDMVQLLNSACYYVNGKVGHVRGKFLIDTGSSICVLSEKVYERIKGNDISLQPSHRQVRAANGTLLRIKGTCTLQIQLDHVLFNQEFIVANIEESLGILGINFLDQYQADVKIRKKILKTNQGRIKLHKQSTDVCNRLQLCENITVPSQSEAYIKTYTVQNCEARLNILEPTNRFLDQGLLIGRTLVDTSHNQMTVSVLNVSDKNIKLKQNVSLGTIHPIDQICKCDDLDSSKVKVEQNSSELPEHLKPLVENCSSDLSCEEKQKLSSLVAEFQDVFMSPDGQLGQTTLAEHYIDTGDTKPFKMPCRRIPMFKREVVQTEIKKMLDQGVIEPSTSPWNSPICLVAKKSGEWRFCVDLRALNSVTRLDTYPLPRTDETLERLSGSQFFSHLDMASGYWQLGLSKPDREKTSFAIPGIGTYMFKVMCFGLKNAPSSFSRLMRSVLGSLQFDKCLVYLDDIIVLGHNFESALENLRAVFLKLRQANLKLKVSKCKLMQKQTVFLGHLVSSEGISCDPEKVKAIKDWPQPRDKTELKAFLGLIGYYRKLVPSFAEIAIPLTRLTRKRVQFEWGTEQETAFEELKERLTQPPILAFPMENGGSFLLDVDASGSAIGGVLSQYQNNEEKVIAYGSHTLNPAQQNYCTTKRELYAVVYFVQHFKNYLLGRKFILRVDHKPLLWLSRFREPTGILARWLSILGAYDYDIIFRQGYLHTNADSLSRKRNCPFPECLDCSQGNQSTQNDGLQQSAQVDAIENVPEIQELIPNWLNVWTKDDLVQFQQQDVCIGEILRLKQSFENKPLKTEIQQVHRDVITLWHQWELLVVCEGLLYRKIENDLGADQFQLITPKEIRDTIFTYLHEQRYAGHFGRDRTITAVKKRFYWPGMSEDIARWCQECQLCVRRKPGPGKGKSALQQIKVYQPMSVVAIDILGPLPRTNNGNEYIIVCGCYYTKWKEAFAVPNQTAATVADKLVQEVFLRFGVPAQLHSDQGRNFESDLFKAICDLFGVEKTRTVPYNPKSDGMIERFNRTLATMLSMFVDENKTDWDDHLPYVMAAYRATQHKSTGVTPNLLMLNRELNFPLDLMVGDPPNQKTEECPIKYVEWIRHAMTEAFVFTHGQLGVAAKRQKSNYDRGLKPREFSVGSWVWRWYPPLINQKLGLGWIGPYLVIQRLSYLTYRIQRNKETNPIVVHVDHLKPFIGRKHPRNWLTEPQEVVEPQQEPAPGNNLPSDQEHEGSGGLTMKFLYR